MTAFSPSSPPAKVSTPTALHLVPIDCQIVSIKFPPTPCPLVYHAMPDVREREAESLFFSVILMVVFPCSCSCSCSYSKQSILPLPTPASTRSFVCVNAIENHTRKVLCIPLTYLTVPSDANCGNPGIAHPSHTSGTYTCPSVHLLLAYSVILAHPPSRHQLCTSHLLDLRLVLTSVTQD